jgi:hypothetical protein
VTCDEPKVEIVQYRPRYRAAHNPVSARLEDSVFIVDRVNLVFLYTRDASAFQRQGSHETRMRNRNSREETQGARLSARRPGTIAFFKWARN